MIDRILNLIPGCIYVIVCIMPWVTFAVFGLLAIYFLFKLVGL